VSLLHPYRLASGSYVGCDLNLLINSYFLRMNWFRLKFVFDFYFMFKILFEYFVSHFHKSEFIVCYHECFMLKIAVLWGVMSCHVMSYSLGDHYQHFREICCLHLQGRRWKQQVSSDIGSDLPDQMASHPQKTVFFTVTTMRTSCLSCFIISMRVKFPNPYVNNLGAYCIKLHGVLS
jgi:hypothetical protein